MKYIEKDVIIALDFSNQLETVNFIEKFQGISPYVKVGMELFYGEGMRILSYLKDMECKVFLDLKLHDIPNTVESAMKVLMGYKVDMVNVHASGGIEMMKRAAEVVKEYGSNTKLIGVTQLTSTDQNTMNEELLIEGSIEDIVMAYGENCKLAGLDGVVCSPLESKIIHDRMGADFLTVTPGIRLPDDSSADQKRITTPERAGELGSNYIVVGRTITRSENPVSTYELVKEKFLI